MAVYASIGNINDVFRMKEVFKMTTRKNKVLGTIASTVAVLSLSLAITPTASASWSANAGTTRHSLTSREAWAWTRVSGNNIGRSYAQMDSARSDTGWHRNSTRTASAYGVPWAHTVRYDYYVN